MRIRLFHATGCAKAFVILFSLSAVGCTSEGPRVAQIEERVDALEAEVAELRAVDPEPTSVSESPPDLSRDAASPTAEVATDPEVVASAALVEELIKDGTPFDLTSTLLAGFADVADFGGIDEEFGGVTIEGDATRASISMFRNGLVHEERVRALLVVIGFAEEAVEGLASGEAAQSEDGRFTASSQLGEDALTVVVELLP